MEHTSSVQAASSKHLPAHLQEQRTPLHDIEEERPSPSTDLGVLGRESPGVAPLGEAPAQAVPVTCPLRYSWMAALLGLTLLVQKS